MVFCFQSVPKVHQFRLVFHCQMSLMGVFCQFKLCLGVSCRVKSLERCFRVNQVKPVRLFTGLITCTATPHFSFEKNSEPVHYPQRNDRHVSLSIGDSSQHSRDSRTRGNRVGERWGRGVVLSEVPVFARDVENKQFLIIHPCWYFWLIGRYWSLSFLNPPSNEYRQFSPCSL